MKNLRIAYSRGKGLLSWLIRVVTRSNVNHTLFVLEERGVEMVIGADWNGLSAQTRARWESKGNTIVDVPALVRNIDDDGIPWLLKNLDTTYDYPALLGMLPVTAARFWLHKRLRNPFAERRALFCSESAAKMLQDIKYPHSEALDPSATDPGFLRDWQVNVAAMHATKV